MAQSSQPMTYLCERCGRAVGQDILACPSRPQGHCPYAKKNLVPLGSRLVGVGFLLVGILSLLLGKQQDFGLGMLIDLGLVGIGFFRTFQTSTLLYNPISKLTWKRQALLGITLERTLILGGKPFHLDLALPQPSLFPPSVTKLSEIAIDKKWTVTQAADLFQTALVGLLARGLIQISQYQQYVARGRGEFRHSQDLYVFTACEETDLASIDGALERRILLVLRSWAARKGGEALEWPNGPPVYMLIRAIYDKDVSSPTQWVFDLVADDAVARAWGQFKGWPRKRFKPDETHEERLRSERAIIDGLSSRFAQQQPDLSQTLAVQINEAVGSRQIQQTYDYT